MHFILSWRKPCDALEGLNEMTCGAKGKYVSYVSRSTFGVKQHSGGNLDFFLGYVLLEGEPCFLFEQGAKIIWTKSYIIGDSIYDYFFMKVEVNIFLHLFYV